jgi:hypothetical protein
MKLNTLNKLPRSIRSAIIAEWNVVYISKAIEPDNAKRYLKGMITALMLTLILTYDEYVEIDGYINQVFSL